MKHLISLLLIFHSFSISANEYWRKSYTKPDSIARIVRVCEDLNGISQSLTTPFSSTEDKYRAIYTWVALNISYDCKAYKNKKLRTSDPIAVVKQRKAVCAGYASLFQTLCQLSNLECEIVSGWAKPNVKGIGNKLDDKKTGHAWNAIRINKEWYLCDPTWGAGYVDEKVKTFTQCFSDFYFCTPPEILIDSHFPKSSRWKLGVWRSKSAFEDRPIVNENGKCLFVEKINKDDGKISFKKGSKINIKMKIDTVVESVVIISKKDKKYRQVCNFKYKEGKLNFTYVMDKFLSEITICINRYPILTYKIESQ